MRLKGALLNVIDHAYNRHGNCSQYFDCPVALGKNTKSSYNAKGEWLDVLGGAALETELRAQFSKRLTSDAQLEKLDGGMSTQRNESLHQMQIRMAPKSRSYGGTNTGEARQVPNPNPNPSPSPSPSPNPSPNSGQGGRTRWRWLDGGADAMPGAPLAHFLVVPAYSLSPRNPTRLLVLILAYWHTHLPPSYLLTYLLTRCGHLQ